MQYICLQENEFDCGFACLKMLLAYTYKNKHFLSLEQDYIKTRYSLLDLKNIAKNYQVELEGINFLKKEEIFAYRNVIIVTKIQNNKHFMLFVKKSGKFIILNDPSLGQIKVEEEEFMEMFLGQGLIVKSQGEQKDFKINHHIITISYLITYMIFLLFDFGLLYLLTYVTNMENGILLSLIDIGGLMLSLMMKNLIIKLHLKKFDEEISSTLNKVNESNLRLDHFDLKNILLLKKNLVTYIYGFINNIYLIFMMVIILISNDLLHLGLILITLLINFIIYKSSYLNLNTKTYQITIFEKNFLNNLNDTPINEKYTTLTQASNKYASALSYNFYIINILIVFLIIFSNYYLDISSYSYVIIFLAYYLFLNEKFKATLNLIFKDKLEYQKSKNAYLSLKNYLQNQKNEGLIEEKKPQKKLKKQN